MMVIVEQSVEWRLAGETEVLGENLPRQAGGKQSFATQENVIFIVTTWETDSTFLYGV
jgi:hypothetical protein